MLTEREMIDRMLAMQNGLNTQIHSEWRSQGYRWERAIIQEASEMMEYTGWKWWKHSNIDMDQALLEVVDIWHFTMSSALATYDDEVLPDLCIQLLNEGMNTPSVLLEPIEQLRQIIEDIILYASCGNISEVIERVGACLEHFNLDIEGLYKYYIGKNVLNKFRQDHGYKEGTYVKVWGESEDNEYLMSILLIDYLLDNNYEEWIYAKLKVDYDKYAVAT